MICMENYEIAALRPEHHAVQGFARNDFVGLPRSRWSLAMTILREGNEI